MKRTGRMALLLAFGCGSPDDTDLVLPFETQPLCAAADLSCLNLGTQTLSVGGIPVIYKYLPGHPLVALQVSFEARLASSRQGWAESFALELLERRGPRRFDSSSWDAEQLRLESSISAGIGLDYGSIHAVAPRFNWREVSDLVFEAMTDLGDSRHDLANLQGIAEQSLLSERDDPGDAADIDAWSRLFAGQPYNFRREHPDLIATVNDGDITAAWATLCQGERLRIAVAGDVDADDIVDVLQPPLDALLTQASNVTFLADAVQASAEQPAIQILPYPEAPTWHIASYVRGPAADSPDYARFVLALDVLDRRLFREIRDVRGLAYSTGAGASFYRESFGSLSITSHAPLQAIPVARQILDELERDGPTEEELAAAVAGRITALLTASDTPTGLASTLMDWQLTAGRREALDDYLVEVTLATSGEVASAARRYLRGAKTAAAGGGSMLTEIDLEALFPSP